MKGTQNGIFLPLKPKGIDFVLVSPNYILKIKKVFLLNLFSTPCSFCPSLI